MGCKRQARKRNARTKATERQQEQVERRVIGRHDAHHPVWRCGCVSSEQWGRGGGRGGKEGKRSKRSPTGGTTFNLIGDQMLRSLWHRGHKRKKSTMCALSAPQAGRARPEQQTRRVIWMNRPRAPAVPKPAQKKPKVKSTRGRRERGEQSEQTSLRAVGGNVELVISKPDEHIVFV